MEAVLTKDQILANHDEFVDLLRGIERPGFNAEEVIRKFESSDFFVAPASTHYHQSYEGGLCQHSLQVYHNLKALLAAFNMQYSEDSIRLVSLFHDLAKTGYYDIEMRNTKIDGQWVQVPYYKVSDEHFVFGSHESTSLYLAQMMCPLTSEEASAILHHHGGMGWDSAKDNISEVFTKHKLSMYLYFADMVSAYDK